jgi:hypothetical protein
MCAVIVETFRPVEIKHAVELESFHEMRNSLEEIAAGQHVDERHERDYPEDGPRELNAAAQVVTRRQVDPHQDYSQRVKETEQQLYQLLHGTSRSELDQQ